MKSSDYLIALLGFIALVWIVFSLIGQANAAPQTSPRPEPRPETRTVEPAVGEPECWPIARRCSE